MLDDYLAFGNDRIEVRYIYKDRSFAEETHVLLGKAVDSLTRYFDLKTPFPLVRAILATTRDEFDRLVADLLGVEIERPSHPRRMAQPQRTDLVILSPSAYEKYSTFEYSPDEYGRLLFHEVTHVFEEYLAPNMETPSRWWSEGLAAYLSEQWKHEDQYGFRQPVLQGLETRRIPDIGEIEASIELCYDWGWTVVMFIEKTYGREFVLRIVGECDNGDVCGMLGEDMDTFQQNWKKWLLVAFAGCA